MQKEYLQKNNFSTGKKKLQIFCEAIDKAVHSDTYLLIVAFVALIGFSFNFQLIAMAILLVVSACIMVSVRDITPILVNMCFISILPLGFYGSVAEQFLMLVPFICLIGVAFVARFFLFPIKYKPDKIFWAQLLYAVTLLFSGIGFTSAVEYFKLTAIYTVLGLGLFQVVFVVFDNEYVGESVKKDIDYFSKAFVYISALCVAIFLMEYIKAIPTFKTDGFSLVHKQWKNNLSNYMLFGMPFCFYRVAKNKSPIISFLVGIFTYLTLLISMCRGGIVFGSLIFPVAWLISMRKLKGKNKKVLLAISIVFATAVLLGVIAHSEYIWESIMDAFRKSDSGRFAIYAEALRIFNDNIVFGGGFGYANDAVHNAPGDSLMYYHSTVFQLLGASGVVGLFGYLVTAYYRMDSLVRNRLFNVFALLSAMGFLGYSLINTGTAVPIPFMTIITYLTVICSRYNKEKIVLTEDRLFVEKE